MSKTNGSAAGPLVPAVLAVLAVLAGCAGSQKEAAQAAPAETIRRATAVIEPRSGSEVAGSAIFIHEGRQVTLQISLEHAPAGEHAVHIHEFGDCSAADGSSAGGHWNPTQHAHGKWGEAPFHLGDIGNVVVGADGTGTLMLTTDRWSMGDGAVGDVLGKAVIIHAAPDDFATQPTGNAGGRIGCGVINAG
jgi:Cu-Zn family superoxide dismutase